MASPGHEIGAVIEWGELMRRLARHQAQLRAAKLERNTTSTPYLRKPLHPRFCSPPLPPVITRVTHVPGGENHSIDDQAIQRWQPKGEEANGEPVNVPSFKRIS